MLDVVVIGAGFSGLQAAYSAKRAGLSVAVVEARDRVGGKIWSVPLASGRGCAELGGAWINDTLQPRVWAYVQKFGLKMVKQRLQGTAVMQLGEHERFEFPFGVTPEVSVNTFPRIASARFSESSTDIVLLVHIRGKEKSRAHSRPLSGRIA